MLGSGCLLIHDTGRRVDVSGFAAVLGSIELPIVTGAIAYDHPITGKVYILVSHQAINCHLMDNHLICPMQCCINGVVINDTPKFCVRNPDDLVHAIEFDDPIDPDATLHILLLLCSAISCFNVRCPNRDKFEDEDIPKINMMYKSPEWDPANPDWAEQSASTMDLRVQLHGTEKVIATGSEAIY